MIDWHQRKWVPNGALLTEDPRCAYLNADFFALARGQGFDTENPGHQWDAILLDIDHTPTHLLNSTHADFYSEEGLCRLKALLKPGGVFALWSNDKPEEEFLALLRTVFGFAEGHVSTFENPMLQETSYNGIYLARVDGDAPA